MVAKISLQRNVRCVAWIHWRPWFALTLVDYSKVAKMIAAEPREQGVELRERYAHLFPYDDWTCLYHTLKVPWWSVVQWVWYGEPVWCSMKTPNRHIISVSVNDAHKLSWRVVYVVQPTFGDAETIDPSAACRLVPCCMTAKRKIVV